MKQKNEQYIKIGLIGVIVLAVAGLLYTSFRGEVVGQAVGESCGAEGKYYLFDSDGDDIYDTLEKCVGGVKQECEGASCPVVQCGNGIVESGEDCDGAALAGAVCPAWRSGTPVCTSACRIDMTPCQQVAPSLAQSPFDITNVGIRDIYTGAHGGRGIRFGLGFTDKHAERGYSYDTLTILANTKAELKVLHDGVPLALPAFTKEGFTKNTDGSAVYFLDTYLDFVSFLAANGPGEYCIDRALLHFKVPGQTLYTKVNELVLQTKECIKISQFDEGTGTSLAGYDATNPPVFRYEHLLNGICWIYKQPDASNYRQDTSSNCPEITTATQLDASNNAKTTYNLYYRDGIRRSRFYWELDLRIPDINMIILKYTKDGAVVEKEIIPFTTTIASDGTQTTQPKTTFNELLLQPTELPLEKGKYCIERIFINTPSQCFAWNLKKCIVVEETAGAQSFQPRFYPSSIKDESPPVQDTACTALDIQPCMDSDGGQDIHNGGDDIYTKGTLSYSESSSTSSKKQSIQDTCIDISQPTANQHTMACTGKYCKVKEYYCDNRITNGWTYAENACAFGCTDGACLREVIKEADVYFTGTQPYTAYTRRIVSGFPQDTNPRTEPERALRGDVIMLAAAAKNKGTGRGQFTYTYKVYYEDVLVSDNGQAVDYAEGKPGTDYFAPNPFATPFRVPGGSYKVLWPETDTISTNTKEHTAALTGTFNAPGRYRVEFTAVDEQLEGSYREPSSNKADNIISKEIIVYRSQPPAFSYAAYVQFTNNDVKGFTGGTVNDGENSATCNTLSGGTAADGYVLSNTCSFRFRLSEIVTSEEASSLKTNVFWVSSRVPEDKPNADVIEIKLSSPQLAQPLSKECLVEGFSFTCYFEPDLLSMDNEYTVEFKSR